MMHFRNTHIADSVTERITAIAENIRSGKALPPPKGAATIHLERIGGDLIVTKTFENGEPEVLTISGDTPTVATPEGFTDVTPNQDVIPDAQTVDQPVGAGTDSSGIVEGAALGGDSLDTLLRK